MSQFRGIAFPFTKSGQSYPAGAEDNDLIRQSILRILTTGPGERVMRPTLGCNVKPHLFENVGEAMEELIKVEIREAIGKFEPRVAVHEVTVQRDDREVVFSIVYVVLATRKVASVSITTPTE